MYEFAVAAATLAFILIAIVYSPILDDEFQDAVDDHRRLNGTWRPAKPARS